MHKPKKNKWPMPESQFQIVLGNVQHWKRHGLGESETLICCLFPENEIQLNEKIKSKIEHKKLKVQKKNGSAKIDGINELDLALIVWWYV